jgi:hypothetical protein
MKEYLKRNSNQTGRVRRAGKRSKQDRRWTLLFIGNHGRTITLKRFQGIVILSIFVFAVAIAVSVGLFVWNQEIIMDNRGLEDKVKSLNDRLDALRHDKDILLTRLVVAESRVQENINRQTEKPKTDQIANQQQPAPAETAPAKPVTESDVKAPVSQQVDPQPVDASSDASLSVVIEDFTILDHTDDNRLKVLFKIKNTSSNSQRVSGHVIVVLKGEQTDWLPIPWMPLVEGRPTGRQRGHTFGINYFKTMRLSTPTPKHPEKYQTASVYVFTRKGELLLEKGFAVNLAPAKPKPAKPSPGVHAMPAENAEPPAAQPPAPEASSPPPSLRDAFREALEGTPSP